MPKEITIKVTEENGIKDGRNHYRFGSIIPVDEEDAKYFCANGWAEAVNGEVPTGQRTLHDVKLDIRGSKHGQQAEKLGE